MIKSNRIEIPFNKWSLERLYDESKCATSRNKKYGNVGDIFYVGDDKYKITMIKKLPLFFIANELFRTEGCTDPQEFIDIWEEIHPRKGWVDEQKVYYHYFVCLDYLGDS